MNRNILKLQFTEKQRKLKHKDTNTKQESKYSLTCNKQKYINSNKH